MIYFESVVKLFILYRLSTIQAADRIVVMDGGHIVEVGTIVWTAAIMPIIDSECITMKCMIVNYSILIKQGNDSPTKYSMNVIFIPSQMGTHGELLRKEGLYARLTRRQADAVA